MAAGTVLKRKVGLFAAALVVAVTATACFANTGNPPTDSLKLGIFNAMNADRQSHGLAPLTYSPKLENLAGTWSDHMAAVGSMYHQDLAYWLSTSDYVSFHTLGENLLVGPATMTADQMETAWRNSPGHWANITSPYFNVVGIGYTKTLDGRIWVCVDFGGI
jgi:uncharacterized protein YkwD